MTLAVCEDSEDLKEIKNNVYMANRKEQAELFKTIWAIANDLRGAVDGWTFKAYVLGAIFYRYISEDICQYIADEQAKAGIPDFDYSAMSGKAARVCPPRASDDDPCGQKYTDPLRQNKNDP